MTDFYRAWTLLAVLYVLLAMAVIPASAQTCLPREALLANLEKQYGESPVGTGIQKNGKTTAELLVAPATGTWTVIVTTPEDISCVIAGGTDFEFSLPEKGDVL